MMYAGLFGYLDSKTTVKNVGIINSLTFSNSNMFTYAGGIVGANAGTITNYYNTRIITGSSVGGIEGVNYRNQKLCYNTRCDCRIRKRLPILGGIVGENKGEDNIIKNTFYHYQSF